MDRTNRPRWPTAASSARFRSHSCVTTVMWKASAANRTTRLDPQHHVVGDHRGADRAQEVGVTVEGRVAVPGPLDCLQVAEHVREDDPGRDDHAGHGGHVLLADRRPPQHRQPVRGEDRPRRHGRSWRAILSDGGDFYSRAAAGDCRAAGRGVREAEAASSRTPPGARVGSRPAPDAADDAAQDASSRAVDVRHATRARTPSPSGSDAVCSSASAAESSSTRASCRRLVRLDDGADGQARSGRRRSPLPGRSWRAIPRNRPCSSMTGNHDQP